MNKLEARGQKLLIDRWNAVYQPLESLMLEARPNDPWGTFSISDRARDNAEEVAFTINPVTFLVPERASASSIDVYINVRGWITLDAEQVERGALQTVGFGTEVAYFRSRNNQLKHVFGVHYDYSVDQLGHPVFHSQIKSFKERAHDVIAHYPHGCSEDDPFKEVLKSVRVPTAQMDFFALLAQICADHLIDQYSDEESLQHFADVRAASAEIKGAGLLLPRLQAANCTRGNHWYL